MSHNITVSGGTSVRLPTAGKYCEQDIIITAEGGGSGEPTIDLSAEIIEQEELIEQIKTALENKTAGGDAPSADGIPSGYSRVDFIEFTGNQLIDTGIIGNQDTQITASFTWGNATQNHLFGCASSDNTASITSYMNGSWRFGAKAASKTITRNNTVLPYAVYMNKTRIGVTGSNTDISGVADFETIGTMLLGGARSSSGALPSSGLVGRIFYFNVWQGDEQAMKLVPVVSADGVYRFWDIISQTFFDSIVGDALGGGNL